MTRWLLLLAVMMSLGTAAAQPGGGGGRKLPANQREQIKKRVRTMRAITLTEELKLDPATAEKLFPLLSKYDDETDKLVQRRGDVNARLNNANGKPAKEIDKTIDDAVALQRDFRDLEDHRLADVRKVLTPAQTAKLIIVLPQFEKRIQNQLQKAIQNRKQGDADVDEDDDIKPPGRTPPNGR